MSGLSVAERVKRTVVEQLGADPSDVTLDAQFVNDLGADSLDSVEMTMAFENEFDLEIPDEDAEKCHTVGQAVAYIEGKISRATLTKAPQRRIEDPELKSTFIVAVEGMASRFYATAKSKGWYDQPREDGTMIALMHSELSEALEALRHGNPKSEKIPPFSHAEEELADAVIRIMDMAAHKGWHLGDAIIAKAEYNKGRAFKHGGKEF